MVSSFPLHYKVGTQGVLGDLTLPAPSLPLLLLLPCDLIQTCSLKNISMLRACFPTVSLNCVCIQPAIHTWGSYERQMGCSDWFLRMPNPSGSLLQLLRLVHVILLNPLDQAVTRCLYVL